jgi:hypothetical protein
MTGPSAIESCSRVCLRDSLASQSQEHEPLVNRTPGGFCIEASLEVRRLLETFLRIVVVHRVKIYRAVLISLS